MHESTIIIYFYTSFYDASIVYVYIYIFDRYNDLQLNHPTVFNPVTLTRASQHVRAGYSLIQSTQCPVSPRGPTNRDVTSLIGAHIEGYCAKNRLSIHLLSNDSLRSENWKSTKIVVKKRKEVIDPPTCVYPIFSSYIINVIKLTKNCDSTRKRILL